MTTTNGNPVNALFSSALISPQVLSALPEGYAIRPLERSDFEQGFLDVLRVLTQVGEITKEEFEQRFDEMKGSTSDVQSSTVAGSMKANAGGYHILVILDGEKKIVGTGALIVERKL